MTPCFVRVEREEAQKKNTWWQVLVFYILDYPGGTLSLALATNQTHAGDEELFCCYDPKIRGAGEVLLIASYRCDPPPKHGFPAFRIYYKRTKNGRRLRQHKPMEDG